MIALGEFPLESWEEEAKLECESSNPEDCDEAYDYSLLFPLLLVFVLSTFVIMVTMLNMLIAIMSDTFGKVYAARDVLANKARLKLVGESEDREFFKVWRDCCCKRRD